MNKKSLLLFVFLLSLTEISIAAVLCPDGSFVAQGPCTLCPDGTFIGGGARCQLAPNGQFVPETKQGPQLTPNGNFIPGGNGMVLCPDGNFVAGKRCVLTPSGGFIGQ